MFDSTIKVIYLLFISFIQINLGKELPVEYCYSDACNDAAEYLFEYINKNADPCKDMSEYSCGNWIKDHKVTRYTPTESTMYQVKHFYKELVFEQIKNLPKTVSVKESSFTERLASYCYEECVQVRRTPERKSWKQFSNAYSSVIKSVNITTPLLKMFEVAWVKAGFPVIFNYDLHKRPDENYCVQMTQYDEFSNIYEEYDDENEETFVENLRNFFMKIKNIIKKYRKYVKIEEDDFINNVDELVNLHKELRRAKLSTRMSANTLSVITLGQFSRLTELNFTESFQRISKSKSNNITINDQTELVTTNLDYVIKAARILSSNAQSNIFQYFNVQLFVFLAPLAVESIRKDIEFAFGPTDPNIFAYPKKERISTREEYCQKIIYVYFPLVSSRLAIKQYFPKEDREEAMVMAKNIKDSFYSMISFNNWLDPETRDKALVKLDDMDLIIGYREWIMDDDMLDEFYQLNYDTFEELLNFNNYLFAIISTQETILLRTLTILKSERNDLSIPGSVGYLNPYTVNAMYSNRMNSIEVPAGMIQEPLFKSGRPPAMNYGMLGSVIGHEMTHGFDSVGSYIDIEGVKNDWWTQESRKKFDELAECFINEYSSIKYDKINRFLNGTKYLRENIADDGGIRQSYEAFKRFEKYEGKRVRLSRLPDITSDQLFFISYSTLWCENLASKYARHIYNISTHSPGKYRVNVPLNNNLAFVNAFNCNAKKPEDMCRLW